MTGILDQIIATRKDGEYARSLDDVVALALARSLGDLPHLDLYHALVVQYPHLILGEARQRLRAKGDPIEEPFARYFWELTHGHFEGVLRASEIIGLKIERLQVGVALMVGSKADRVHVLNLRYGRQEAERSVAGVLRHLIASHPHASFSIEVTPDVGTRRAGLIDILEAAAQDADLPLRLLETPELQGAFAVPACKTREQVRAVVQDLYRALSHPSDITIDALAVGIVAYCHHLLGTGEDGTP